MLAAACSPLGIVTVDGLPVPEAEVLSEGKATSEGILLIEGETVRYIALSAADLKTSLDLIGQALTKVVTGLNGAGAGLNGIAPGSGASVIVAATQLTAIVTQISALKETLK